MLDAQASCVSKTGEMVMGALQPAQLSQEPRWYAAYTHARHEKRVDAQARERGIECFLPLYRSMRRWKDRRKELELPLFPGYVFVQIPLRSRLGVLTIPGVTQLVMFGGVPAPLPE